MYRLARECPTERFMDEALALLARHVAFESARIGHGALHPHTLERLGGHWHGYREPDDILDAYMEVRSQDEPALKAITEGGMGRVVNYESHERFGERRDAGIRAYHRRFEHEANLTIFDAIPSASRLEYRYVVAYRAHEGRPFDAEAVAFVRSCWPHLKESIALNASGGLHAFARGQSREWALSIADLGGRFLVGDTAMRQLLLAAWPTHPEGWVPAPLWEVLRRRQSFRGCELVAMAERHADLVFLRVRPEAAADSLTSREYEVARRLAAGRTHKEIALDLRIAPATARNHIQRIHEKLGARNTAAVVHAIARLR